MIATIVNAGLAPQHAVNHSLLSIWMPSLCMITAPNRLILRLAEKSQMACMAPIHAFNSQRDIRHGRNFGRRLRCGSSSRRNRRRRSSSNMRRCSSSSPSAGMPAPLIDGVTLRCAAPLANHAKPLRLLAARSVETLSGMKSHCKAVPAWASVTLSVSSARAGTPAGPARHSAAPEGGSIGTAEASVLPAVGPEVPEASCGRQRTNENPNKLSTRYHLREYYTRRISADSAWWAPARARRGRDAGRLSRSRFYSFRI